MNVSGFYEFEIFGVIHALIENSMRAFLKRKFLGILRIFAGAGRLCYIPPGFKADKVRMSVAEIV